MVLLCCNTSISEGGVGGLAAEPVFILDGGNCTTSLLLWPILFVFLFVRIVDVTSLYSHVNYESGNN